MCVCVKESERRLEHHATRLNTTHTHTRTSAELEGCFLIALVMALISWQRILELAAIMF